MDAASRDDTVAIARPCHDRIPLQIIVQPCSRGEGRNLGAAATGDLLAFIDGDCIANAHWCRTMREAWAATSAASSRAARTLLFLAIRNAGLRMRPPPNWLQMRLQFSIHFEGRMPE